MPSSSHKPEPRPRRSARDAAVHIVRRLRSAGHVAYFAGGCVRDALLGLQPKDYDIATDALPEQVRKLLPRSRYVGEAFGVVLVHESRHAIEVATFRCEWGYSDKRRPDHVIFTDAQHDALRRDFTVNGLFADPLAVDPDTGGDTVIDYVGGIADLQAKLIRAIGDPSERFGEDYLRMLRAARFAARLGFTVEPRTAAAIRPLAKYLGQISRERIGQEVLAMLQGPNPAHAAALVQSLKLDGPTLNEPHRDPPLPTLQSLTRQHPNASHGVKLAAWMIDRHVPTPTLAMVTHFVQQQARRLISKWRAALSLSNDHRDKLQQVLTLVSQAQHWPDLPVAQRKRLLAQPNWPEAMQLLQALDAADEMRQIESESQPLIAEGVAPDPLVTGQDLIAMGLEPGPDFRRLLDGVYDAQLEHRVRDREQALAWLKREA